jgi:hypothetical protein
MLAVFFGSIVSAILIVAGQQYYSRKIAKENNLIDQFIEFLVGLQVSILEMQKEKRKQSNDEEDDSSSRKRRKADLSKPVSFISTGKVEISRAESIIIIKIPS